MISPWITHCQKPLLQTRIFQLASKTCSSPQTQVAHDFYVIEAPTWINVIPIINGDQVLMVQQYRHGREEVTLEIPGGVMDPSDSSPADAARRELIEETGYWAESIQPLGSIAPNPAIQNNLCYSFLATGLELRGPQSLDSSEEIDILQVPLQDIPLLIQQGKITHALVVVAFCYFFGLAP